MGGGGGIHKHAVCAAVIARYATDYSNSISVQFCLHGGYYRIAGDFLQALNNAKKTHTVWSKKSSRRGAIQLRWIA
jgi:hypothetical protein